MRRTPQRKDAGLTLVELLLGLAIGALLMMPLAGLLQDAAEGGADGHARLDLNGELRFALDRIAARATVATPWWIALSDSYTGSGMLTVPAVAAWMQTTTGAGKAAPGTTTTYALVGNPQTGANLVETQVDTPGNATRTSVIAANVTAFRLSAPDLASGQPLLTAELTLSKGGATVSGARTFRLWGWQ